MHINHADFAEEILSSCFFQQLFTADNQAAMVGQYFEQIELGIGQLYFLAVNPNAVSGRIQAQMVKLHHLANGQIVVVLQTTQGGLGPPIRAG